ncbi:GNAT family N-acetyltransferase [Faecalispora anaeroviscerum]|uniref:GNAT family N-acetyltransferase n=1 Tax=Faecalispora anaeroviscerum TaxID=2991836 RepID=UPI0024B95CA8|nr:GNAT family N-acetyltransferase [Faecalispora anaeroviscerum]
MEYREHDDYPIYRHGILPADKKAISQPSWVLETPRLGFRHLRVEDLTALRPILGDVQTMYAWEYGFTDEQIAEWIARANRRYQTCGYSHHAAIQKESGELVGLMGVLPEEIDGKTCFGLGYIVARRFWGQGYAAEGAAAWLRYAFEQLGAQQVIADIRPQNTASRRVAERLGMTVIGEHTKHHNGKEMPHLIYAKNRKEG